MTDLRIAVILGSTRPGRRGEEVANWVVRLASARPGAAYELVDLARYALPLLDEPVPAFRGQYAHEHTRAWAAAIATYDGFVFVTPEYNRSTSAALKNAIDYLYAEWVDKAAAFVGYGRIGAARAIDHLRGITAELELVGIRQELNFSLHSDYDATGQFAPSDYHTKQARVMFDELERWARALQAIRLSETSV